MNLTETLGDFKNWLANAKTGDRAIYACRAACVAPLGQRTEVATEAWKAYQAGFVELVQRRVPKIKDHDGGGVFDYIAVRK